jgi:kynurenine 3-monooxygenase
MRDMPSKSPEILIIGAGLAGSLLSVYLARMGFEVSVYERRPDRRKVKTDAGKSINLALSTRGLHALKEVGLDREILKQVIPMKGRMIHSLDGSLTFQPYGINEDEVINSVSRGQLNMVLMNAAEESGKVQIYFHEKCDGINFNSGEVRFYDEKSGNIHAVSAGLVIATDGANSAIRTAMQKMDRFNFLQSYLEHGYKELTIPASSSGEFLFERNALHIWPRKSFMMIALPNLNGTFTCTLFLPFEGNPGFNTLNDKQNAPHFFKTQFPDAVPLMPIYLQEFFQNPTGSLVTIKCYPWKFGNNILLLGDSAHAIVPFFGQGMNCAFEDCSYLIETIKQHGADWGKVFSEYQRLRKEDTDAIADMALENFIEMRDSVTDQTFQLKKKAEILLEKEYPDRFRSRYAMVSFSRVPYSVAMNKGKIQDEVLIKRCSQINSIDELNLEDTLAEIESRIKKKFS